MKQFIFAVVLVASVFYPNASPAAPATPAESLKVLEGFKVELLRSASKEEGSWVAMTVDNKGRLILSSQGKEPMERITLSRDGQIEKVEPIELPVSGAMGLLYAFDSLYVNGEGPQGHHLYRLADTTGRRSFRQVELLRNGKEAPESMGRTELS